MRSSYSTLQIYLMVNFSYRHIPQSSDHLLFHTHRTEAFSGISSAVHHRHLNIKRNIMSNKLGAKISSLWASRRMINLPFSIQSISLLDSASIGISFLIFISVYDTSTKNKQIKNWDARISIAYGLVCCSMVAYLELEPICHWNSSQEKVLLYS